MQRITGLAGVIVRQIDATEGQRQSLQENLMRASHFAERLNNPLLLFAINALRLERIGHVASALSKLGHHLLVQPNIHLG